METFLAECSIAVSGIVASRAPLREGWHGGGPSSFRTLLLRVSMGPGKVESALKRDDFPIRKIVAQRLERGLAPRKDRSETRLPCKRVSCPPQEGKRAAL
ncbi:hypothetical protein NPIL_547991 [Nephila pilipes]|uniref:Uncharacterized protein n=1 Tax=Nephila pilipes TaxID=299642 RepID=A0A8X6PQV2_NEPPI|nr:hypothetical protein NPIL_547991 [Nephila pilipes]